MTDEPRHLRLLMIEDEQEQLDGLSAFFMERGIELVKFSAVPHYSPYKGAGITSWAQLVGVLHARWERDPKNVEETMGWDLLLADVRFDQDTEGRVPPYPPGQGQTGEDRRPDPMGMLLALALIARRNANPLPYGWALRSAGGGGVAEDPLAIRLYCLLHALIGRAPGLPASKDRMPTWRPTQLPETASTFLNAMPATTNTGMAWGQAVTSLREAILGGCREGRLQVSIREPEASFLELASSSSTAKNRAIKLRHCGVLISASGGRTAAIQLRSLFADRWDVDRNALNSWEEAERWLADLRAVASPGPDALLETHRRWKAGNVDVATVSGHEIAAWMVFHFLEQKCGKDEVGTSGWQDRETWGERRWTQEFWKILGNPEKGGPQYKAILDHVKRATGATIERLAAGLLRGDWPAEVHPTVSEAGRSFLAALGVAEEAWPACIREM